MIIDNEQMRFLLTSLCNLSDLRLESCLILQDDELAGETACPAFLQLLDICAPVLTSMWFPARAFYALEVHRVALLQPRLKRLAITLGLGAADALPTLCNRLKGTLESLRLSGFLVGNFQAELERDQKQIVDAVRAAGKLTSLECFSLILSTATWKNILKAMGSRIQYFYVEVNPSETKDVQFANIVDIIECAALHSRGLRRFSIENNMQYELTASSPLADKLTAAVEKLLRCAPTLSESDLRSLLEVWIPNCESIREERT